MSGSVEIYKSKDGDTSVQVTFDKETVWLSQAQLSTLFGRDRTVVGRHIRNIFKEGELGEELVSADFAHTTQHGAIAGKTQRKVTKYYNLDVIISVGYRVKSIQGTHFRQWASKRLKEYLIKGYSLNNERLNDLKHSFSLIKNTINNPEVNTQQIKEVVDVLSEFALGLDILDGYDHQNLKIKQVNSETKYKINYKESKEAIEELRTKFGGSELFGNEKDDSFKSSIASISQTFDGKDLYPSLDEKAANLLYFVVKNHSFTDGNKRIAAWLFVWYLNKNDYLFSKNGKRKIANNALAALTLMVALSKPEEKELIIKVIINSIDQKNETQ
jgi:prophage maintenance system killer protein